jgi:glycosyltransferase involved in cell wall biosynthesis
LKTLSVVIPVYNESETLLTLIDRVLKAEIPLEKELILVDDYSTDGTRDLYPTLSEKFPGADIKVFMHDVNKGKGAAVRLGFTKITGDLAVIQDADLEYDPDDYPKLLKPLLDGRADVVYGSRFVGGDEHRVLYYWHYLGNRFLTTVSNCFTNLNLTDMETCYKCMKAEVVRSMKLKSDRFGIEPEMTQKIARGGWRVYEVGISYSGRSYEEGKKITWKDGVRALYSIVKYAWFA